MQEFQSMLSLNLSSGCVLVEFRVTSIYGLFPRGA